MGRRSRLSKLAQGACAVLTGVGLVGVGAPAHAYETEVDASVDAQLYSFQSPYGEPLIRRRRLTDTVGLSLYDLQGERKHDGPALSFRSRLRLDADFGMDPAESDPNSSRFVPGVQPAPLDLMYAYLEGQRYFGGLVGFRLGRQYVTDMLGWWSFDGGLVSITTPAFLRIEAYGGLEQRSGLPLLGTSRYQADGVARGSRDSMQSDQYTSYLEQSLVAPAVGVALETSGLDWLDARVTYRRVLNRDTVLVSPFIDAGDGFVYAKGDRISTERFGASGRISHPDFGAIYASDVYDLYTQKTGSFAAGLDAYVSRRVTLGADYDYFLPIFDGDSIWNWFSHAAQRSATGRADVRVSRRLDASATGGIRVFETRGDSVDWAANDEAVAATREVDFIGSLGGGYRWNDGSVSTRGVLETGERGHRVGGDVTTRKTYDAGYYDTLVVLSLYDWEDSLRDDRYATSFAYVLGAGFSPGIDFLNRGRLGIEWEHAMNRLVGQRYRVLATLDFSVLR
ncbi:MAG TPA: hypothetical protein VF103_09580 [Polyangiaceae bacterium]